MPVKKMNIVQLRGNASCYRFNHTADENMQKTVAEEKLDKMITRLEKVQLNSACTAKGCLHHQHELQQNY